MTRIESELNLIVDEFLNSIRRRIRIRDTYTHRSNYNFDILGIANDDYYEYRHLEKEMSAIVRETLINKSLHMLFRLHNIQTKWVVSNKHLSFADSSWYEEVFSNAAMQLVKNPQQRFKLV